MSLFASFDLIHTCLYLKNDIIDFGPLCALEPAQNGNMITSKFEKNSAECRKVKFAGGNVPGISINNIDR